LTESGGDSLRGALTTFQGNTSLSAHLNDKGASTGSKACEGVRGEASWSFDQVARPGAAKAGWVAA